MAGGEGGFSTKAMGFDKKEVNDYIANLNQRMKEIEAEKKANDEKTQAALKKAQEADAAIKAVKVEGDKKIAELEAHLKAEIKNKDKLTDQLDDLKRKMKHMNAAGAAGNTKDAESKSAAIIAKANATAKEIVDKANATARDTVEKAKAAATKMVTDAQGASGAGVNSAALDEFMSVLNKFMTQVTSGVNEVNQKAGELLGAENTQPITVPDFSNISAPQAEAPKAAATAAKAAPVSKASAKAPADDLFALLEDDDDKNDDMDDGFDMITEVQPLDDPASAPGAVVLEEFDLSAPMEDLDLDAPVSEVRPLDEKKRGNDHYVDDDFEKQILAQTANSSSLRRDMDEDLLAAVKQQEERFAVKPTKDDVGKMDMDSAEDEDPLAAMLRQAELAFGGATGDSVSNDYEEDEQPAAASSGGDDNPWAALQNELMAMEKSGDLEDQESESDASPMNDVVTPGADDSSLWDFGDGDSGSSDDDMGMSSDLFGGF